MRLATFSTLLTLTLSFTPLTVPVMVQSSWGQETVETDIETLLQQAIQQARQGKPLESIETWKQLLIIARQQQNRELEAFSLLGLGFNYDSIGQRQQALEQYNQALVIFREVGDRSGEAVTLNNIGLVYRSIGKPTEALDYYEQALPISREVGDRSGEAVTLNNIGAVYNNIGKPTEALDYYEQALPIMREVGDRSGEATTLNNIGAVYDNIGKPTEALDYYEQALPIRREVGDRSGEATTLNNIGAVYRSIGKPTEALDYYEQALPIMREVGDRSGEATTLNNIGAVYRSIGKPTEALDYYEQALPIRREVGDRSGEATTLNNIGAVYRSIGKPTEALDYYEQALPIMREVGDRSGEATTLNNIGAVYRSIGKPTEALDYYEQALPIRREVGDRSGEADTLNNIGLVYLSIGKPTEALDYYQQALPIRREVGDRSGEATTLNNIGAVYDNIGKPTEALDYYEQALPISREVGDRSGEATTLNNIGAVYRSIGKPTEALDYYEQALPIRREVGDRSGEATTLSNIGGVYDNIGKPTEALDYYQQALPIRREVGDRSGEATTLNNIGLVYRSIGKPTEAINALEAAVTIYLDIRRGLKDDDREAYLAAEEGTAVALVNLLIDQKQAQKAYEWANLATTFELADYTRLIDAADKVNNPDAKKAVQDWNNKQETVETLRQRLQANFSETLAQQLQQQEAKLNQLAETLAKQYPEVAELFETTPEDITRLQKTIPAGTVVIQPVLLNNNIAIFILTSDTLTVKKVSINPQDFNQLIEDYRAILSNRFKGGWRRKGGELYDILIRPIETEIKQLAPQKIAIIATEKLRYIPFETLYDSSKKQYFIEQYPIHYYTRLSVNSIALQENQTPTTTQVLALGNPKPNEPYHLPAAEEEVKSIPNIFPDSEVYIQKDATLTNFKLNASRFNFLHLATHGCFFDKKEKDQETEKYEKDNPCCLANCGQPNHVTLEANTLLFADQNFNIANANELGLSNTELIIISACKTALRQNSTGQEISGIAYLFERVGAKAVMASLWNVEDDSTKEIMLQFYTNIAQGMNKTEALTEAKLSQRNRHPAFWSPFILSEMDNKPITNKQITINHQLLIINYSSTVTTSWNS